MLDLQTSLDFILTINTAAAVRVTYSYVTFNHCWISPSRVPLLLQMGSQWCHRTIRLRWTSSYQDCCCSEGSPRHHWNFWLHGTSLHSFLLTLSSLLLQSPQWSPNSTWLYLYLPLQEGSEYEIGLLKLKRTVNPSRTQMDDHPTQKTHPANKDTGKRFSTEGPLYLG